MQSSEPVTIWPLTGVESKHVTTPFSGGQTFHVKFFEDEPPAVRIRVRLLDLPKRTPSPKACSGDESLSFDVLERDELTHAMQ
jgi:hypothetical protein